MGIYQMTVMSWCTGNAQIRSKSDPNGFARILKQKFFFESDRIGMVASHSDRSGLGVEYQFGKKLNHLFITKMG